jgi:hypothetical protein
MPESIFGHPSQLLTQSVSGPASSGNGTPTPVYQPPPCFADVQFGTIGKPPNLLSRISAPDLANIISRSPSPVTPSPSPVPTHDRTNWRKLAERIQMSPPQQNSPIQPSPAGVHEPLSKPRIDRSRYVASNPSSNLIPPIKILSVASESNLLPPSTQHLPLQQAQALADALPSSDKVRGASTPELVYPITPTIEQSNLDIVSSFPNPFGSSNLQDPAASPPQPMQSPAQIQSSLSLMPAAFPSPNLPFTAELSSNRVPDTATPAATQQQVVQDNLSAIHARLRDASASLALPTFAPRSPSPLAAPSNISELAAGLRSETNTEEPNIIVLRHPYPQHSSTANGNLSQGFPSGDSNALALTNSHTPNLPASRNIHLSSLVEAMQKLQTAASAAVQVQLDADQAFESERMQLDERQTVFEEHVLAREAEYQAQMQGLQKQLDEIRAREQRLVALEEESRLREETRRARDAQRRARDDQRKLEDESRRAAIQEEIVDAMQLLEEAQAEKQRWQEERVRAESDKALAQDNVPPPKFSIDVGPRAETEDGMDEEEVNLVHKYNQYLAHVGQFSTKLQPLIAGARQLSNALQRKKEMRLQAAEVERQQIADEAESQRVQAEAERQRVQAEAEMQRVRAEAERQKAQAEADRQRVQAEEATKRNEERSGDQMMDYQGPQQPVSVGGEPLLQADLTQQQAELRKARSHSDRQAEYARLRAQVLANKQQITSENAARIRAERAGLVAPSATHGDGPDDTNVEMEVDQLESSPVGLTLPLPGQQATPPRKPASKIKETPHSQGTSGNVMLAIPSTATSRPPDARTPSTPTTVTLSNAPASYKTPSFVSASTEVGRQVITDAPLYPTEFASELNSPISSPNGPIPTSKNIPFPTTPKSKTILTGQLNECTIGPLTSLSPAHQDANLRYIKKNRFRFQNNSGDRHVKQPDDGLPIKTIKTEDVVDRVSLNSEQTSSAQEEASTISRDAMNPIQNDDPPPAQAISNFCNSQQHNIPQISTEFTIGQVPNVSSPADTRVSSVGDCPSWPMPRLSTTPISPDSRGIDASVERGGWTAAVPASPHSELSESAYHRGPVHGSRQNSQTSARTPSTEPHIHTQHRHDPHYPDHYSPPPVSPSSSRPRPLEQSESGTSRFPVPPRPQLVMAGGRKRPAESDIEDDSRDYRRPRGDYYGPERNKYSRNIRRLTERHSPERSISPDDKPYTYRLWSPEHGPKYSPTIPDRRRTWNEDSYRPDYINDADSFQHPLDAGYMTEEHAAHDEPQEGIALLERMSSAPVGTFRGARTEGS